MDDPEPEKNISGTGGEVSAFATGEPATRAEAVVDRLGGLYWTKTYGGRPAFECLVRTILSQNTADATSQPAHDALVERYGGDGDDGADEDESPDDGVDLAAALADADPTAVAEVIRPAGLHNTKSERIVEVARRILAEYGSAAAFDAFVREGDPTAVRETLLEMNGVGPKTADCVLLFAGGRGGVFPVDTHVHRIARRMGLAPPDADHETVREHLEADVPAEKCGFGHTATIQFGREFCTAERPACLDDPETCPLADLCDQVGVDPAAGTVVDPAETVGE